MATFTRSRTLAASLAVSLSLALMPSLAAARGTSDNAAPQAVAKAKGFVEGPADGRDLAPGEFQWDPQAAPAGEMVVVVSLPEQRLHVYRDGVRIAVSTISSGKSGKETPTGTFTILQKKVKHNSNLYNNAPMPYMQRLTWDGIALHAGALPGYPASHGCVRLPLAFAKLLFGETTHGMTVVVADELSHGLAVVYPGDSAPVHALSGVELLPDAGNVDAIDIAASASPGTGTPATALAQQGGIAH